jgi:hypothetical protein
VFHDLKNVKIAEKSLKIDQLLPILANFRALLGEASLHKTSARAQYL